MFRVSGRGVFTNGDTDYKGKKSGCDDLGNGSEIELKGRVYSDGGVLALEIKAEKKKDKDED